MWFEVFQNCSKSKRPQKWVGFTSGADALETRDCECDSLQPVTKWLLNVAAQSVGRNNGIKSPPVG